MALKQSLKGFLRRPETIPGPGAMLYSAVVTRVLSKPEAKIAGDVVQHTKQGTVLDLGSGPGFLVTEIARKSPGLRVCGIDLSRQMVKIASRRAGNAGNAHFVFGSAARLPFKDSSIDLVVSTLVFHHVKSPLLAFDECYRVLKPGGEAWIYDGSPDALSNPDKSGGDHRYGFLFRRVGGALYAVHGFTREEYETGIKGVLDQTGFKGSYQMELTDIFMKLTLRRLR